MDAVWTTYRNKIMRSKFLKYFCCFFFCFKCKLFPITMEICNLLCGTWLCFHKGVGLREYVKVSHKSKEKNKKLTKIINCAIHKYKFIYLLALYSAFQVFISQKKCEKYLCSFREAPAISLLATFFMLNLDRTTWDRKSVV